MTITPRLPASWKEASLDNVKVGNNALSLRISVKGDHTEYKILQTQPEWKVIIDVENGKKVFLNGEERQGDGPVSATGAEITLKIY